MIMDERQDVHAGVYEKAVLCAGGVATNDVGVSRDREPPFRCFEMRLDS